VSREDNEISSLNHAITIRKNLSDERVNYGKNYDGQLLAKIVKLYQQIGSNTDSVRFKIAMAVLFEESPKARSILPIFLKQLQEQKQNQQ
jgi:hypothetical protein